MNTITKTLTNSLKLAVAVSVVALLGACASPKCCPKANADCPVRPATCPLKKSNKNMKLTKDMFYKDGKFDQKAAIDAYVKMMEGLGYKISENLRKNMWASDFNLGDFPNVGMGGIIWAIDDKTGVFGHEILLLPNQMLIEHWHVADKGMPAKNECWHARAGKSYCFGEEGEDASKYPYVKVPESQKKFVTVNKVNVADSDKGNIVWMSGIGARHYQIAGPEGAVVTEYGAFHSGENNRYTNPDVKF